MSDGFVDPDRPAFSLDQLRQDEEALDKRASLVDTKTDVDYRETFSLIGRCIILIRFYWRRYIVVLSMDWIATVISVAVAPWAGKVLIDNVVLGQPIKDDGGGYPAFLLPVLEFLEGSSAFTIMSWLAMWTIAALVARVFWQYVEELIGSRLEHSMLHMVRSRLFESLRSLPVTKLDDQPIGDSVYRAMHDVRGIPQIIQRLVRTPGGALLTFFTALFTMLSAYPDSPVVVLFAIGALPVFLLATTPFSRMLRRRAQAQVAAGTVLVSTTEEGMDNIQAVQSLGANKIEKARFSRVSADQFRRDRFALFARNLVEQFGEIAGQFLYWAFMLYLLGKVITNELTPGDYAVVFGYYWTMSKPANELVRLWIDLQSPVARARRVFAMMDLQQEEEVGRETLPTISSGIEFQNVGLVYPDGRRALRDVNFKASIGEIVALAGPTGAGKTTLAYLIPRYHMASEGQVLIDGHDVNNMTIDSLRSQITYVFQETETLADSIADNIRYGAPNASLADVERVAKVVGIHDFISGLPQGYETQLGTTNSKLSVGQKQRISIARGLIRNTPVMILDEPTSALDPETENYLIAALREAAKNRLIIVIAHRLSTITSADKIIFLEDGHVYEQGSHEALMGLEDGHYRRFVELQTA